jgi:hypothetical protein
MVVMPMKIKWIPRSKDAELLVPTPQPARNYVPEWYKNIPPSILKNATYEQGENKSLNLKSCMPFLDSLSIGYIQETWADVVVKIEDTSAGYRYQFNQRSGPQVLSVRENHQYPIKSGYVPFEFVWQVQWLPILPKGYSALFLPVLNRPEGIVNTVSGVMDSDSYFHNHGNLPFHLEFTGNEIVIPCGTPMYQIVPLHRDNWVSEAEEFDDDRSKVLSHHYIKTYASQYVRKYWTKKKYD